MSSRYWNEKDNDLNWWPVIRDILLALVMLIAAGMYGCPQYHVWSQGLVGQAELRRAEQNRQIKVQEATAAQESARHLAQAEIERARGAAEANKIIGDSLKGNEAYLRYLWICHWSTRPHPPMARRSSMFPPRRTCRSSKPPG